MRDTLIGVILIVLIVGCIISIGIGIWYIGRQVNYNLLYKSLVKETVIEMVKAEALK